MLFGRSNRYSRSPVVPGVHPLIGGIAGGLLEAAVMKRVGRLAGGGLKGVVVGAAATYALSRFLSSRRR